VNTEHAAGAGWTVTGGRVEVKTIRTQEEGNTPRLHAQPEEEEEEEEESSIKNTRTSLTHTRLCS